MKNYFKQHANNWEAKLISAPSLGRYMVYKIPEHFARFLIGCLTLKGQVYKNFKKCLRTRTQL